MDASFASDAFAEHYHLLEAVCEGRAELLAWSLARKE